MLLPGLKRGLLAGEAEVGSGNCSPCTLKPGEPTPIPMVRLFQLTCLPTDRGGEGFEWACDCFPSWGPHRHSLQRAPRGLRGELGPQSLCRMAGCPGLGQVSAPQGGLWSHKGLAFLTEQDVGLLWRVTGPRLELGALGQPWVCAGGLFPMSTVDNES